MSFRSSGGLNMKQKLISLLIAISALITVPAYAGYSGCLVQESFGYSSFGLGPLPVPIPTYAIGYRAQSEHHGVDISLQASTVVVLTQLKPSLLYHYYPNPSYCSQFYFGAGFSPSYVFGSGEHLCLLSPEFVFGK